MRIDLTLLVVAIRFICPSHLSLYNLIGFPNSVLFTEQRYVPLILFTVEFRSEIQRSLSNNYSEIFTQSGRHPFKSNKK